MMKNKTSVSPNLFIIAFTSNQLDFTIIVCAGHING